MPTGEDGLRRIFTEIVGGLATSSIMSAFVTSGTLDSSFAFVFHLINALLMATLLMKMKYWGTTYILGWLGGLMMMSPTGLIEPLEFSAYTLVPIIILTRRYWD